MWENKITEKTLLMLQNSIPEIGTGHKNFTALNHFCDIFLVITV